MITVIPLFLYAIVIGAIALGYVCRWHATKQFLRPPTHLLDFPMEVLTEILLYLEWNDILQVRQTSRHLQRVSHSRLVWTSLVKRYMAIVHPRQLWPEKPLSRYTSPELQHLVFQWKSVRAGWLANQLEMPIRQQRHFLISEQSAPYRSCVYLVEGGRWLLMGTRAGAVQYYDLNADNITSTTLVPSPFDSLADVWISVDMDSSAESLTFHLAVMTRRIQDRNDPEYHHSTPARWIQVWRITSHVDLEGSVKGLISELKSSFPEEYEPTCLSFRLRGHQVAYCMFYPDLQAEVLIPGHKILVVDWTACYTTSLNYIRKSISTKGDWLALLPHDKLLCYTDVDFILYDLTNAPTTTLPSEHQQYHPPTASMFIQVRSISSPYFLPDSTRLTFLTMNGVKGITIANSRASSLDLVDLFTGNVLGHFICIGYNFAAMIHFWPAITILHYAWPEESPYSSFFKHTISLQDKHFPDPNLLIDLSSGRVVICGDRRKKQYILEPFNFK